MAAVLAMSLATVERRALIQSMSTEDCWHGAAWRRLELKLAVGRTNPMSLTDREAPRVLEVCLWVIHVFGRFTP